MALTGLSWLYRSLGLVPTTGRGLIADQLGSGVLALRRCRAREISFVSSVGVAGWDGPECGKGLAMLRLTRPSRFLLVQLDFDSVRIKQNKTGVAT